MRSPASRKHFQDDADLPHQQGGRTRATRICPGRKSWLFAGSHRAAAMTTLIMTAKLIRWPGAPMCSLASPISRSSGLLSCCRATGNPPHLIPPLPRRPDHSGFLLAKAKSPRPRPDASGRGNLNFIAGWRHVGQGTAIASALSWANLTHSASSPAPPKPFGFRLGAGASAANAILRSFAPS